MIYTVVPGDSLVIKVRIVITYEGERRGDWDVINGRFLANFYFLILGDGCSVVAL